MLLSAFHLTHRPIHCSVGPRASSRARLQGGKDAKEPAVDNEQLDDPNHSSTFVVLAFLRSSSRAGGLMTWASVSRLLKGKCRSNTKKRALFTNNRAYTAEALRCCWSWKEMAPNTTPKSRSMGNVERNLPKSRLKGAWWLMMFSSSREKTSHQTKPIASPERSARPIVLIL